MTAEKAEAALAAMAKERDQWIEEVQVWRKDLKREKDAHALTTASLAALRAPVGDEEVREIEARHADTCNFLKARIKEGPACHSDRGFLLAALRSTKAALAEAQAALQGRTVSCVCGAEAKLREAEEKIAALEKKPEPGADCNDGSWR